MNQIHSILPRENNLSLCNKKKSRLAESNIQKIFDELIRISPKRIDREELCYKANISASRLAYLLRAYPDNFRSVIITKEKNNLFFMLNCEKFIL